ncbi:MAG: HD domain-containing protein [Planctomycetota bacterium]|nr:MAG: HD domain-containing protein [Planctomycetota bacterium]
MSNDKLRRQITYEAARMMYVRQESEYYRAKMKAARRICQGWVKPANLPTNREIRDEIQTLARLHEGAGRTANLRDMRIEALRVMKLLATFRPRLIGSTMTGHVRQGSDIDIHVFSDSIEAVTGVLDGEGFTYDVERKQVRKYGEERVFTHVHVQDRFPLEITVYAANLAHYVFKSSITGKAIERASIAELEELLAEAYPGLAIDDALVEAENRVDRFQIYQMLLLPLETVKQDPRWHPEGDALYHSLQVFERARDALPYDEEFQTAALLHDVGKAIDPREHVAAALESLEGYITERTAWFIEHHMEAGALRDGTLGARARRRLEAHEDFEELMLLCDCDRAGRECGVQVPEVEEALDHLRDLSQGYGG